jgi:hypothetical protein
MAIVSRRKKNAAPDFKVGDFVQVNMHATIFRGKTGTVVDIRQDHDNWVVLFDDGGNIFAFYAYKLDVVGRAAGFNNQMAWRQLMKGDDLLCN